MSRWTRAVKGTYLIIAEYQRYRFRTSTLIIAEYTQQKSARICHLFFAAPCTGVDCQIFDRHFNMYMFWTGQELFRLWSFIYTCFFVPHCKLQYRLRHLESVCFVASPKNSADENFELLEEFEDRRKIIYVITSSSQPIVFFF